MKSRSFVIGTATVVVSISTSFYSCSPFKVDYNPKLAEPHFLSMILDTETLLEVGQNYLKNNPREENENRLAKALIESLSNDKEKIINKFDQRVRSDFDSENIEILDGWMLSNTEAKQSVSKLI